MKMRFFSINHLVSGLTALAALLLFAVAPSTAANPIISGATMEITIDNFDCGGNASGTAGSSGFLLGSIGVPIGVLTSTGTGLLMLNAGYMGQDLVAPYLVTSIWNVNGGRAKSITLQWIAPGDNQQDDSLNSGSLFYISTTTVQSDALNLSYWTPKRASPDIVISTSGVAAKSLCTYTITGLMPATSYYIRIWTMDQATNWSELSMGGTTYGQPVVLSVYVVDPSTIDFGWQQTAVSTVAPNGIVVRNNGNVNESYALSIQTGTIIPNDAAWISTSTAGTSRFVMYSVFNSTRPQAVNFNNKEGNDVITPYNISADNTNFSMGNISATNITPQMTNPLISDTTMWLRLDTPLSVATTAQQHISVTVTASESP